MCCGFATTVEETTVSSEQAAEDDAMMIGSDGWVEVEVGKCE